MIKFSGVSLKLAEKQIFQNFDLVIKSGEKVVFASNSGKGKTSLFKLILGFLQTPTGSISVNNLPVTPQSIKMIRNSISYLSQDIDLPKISVTNFLSDLYSYQANINLQKNQDQISSLLKHYKLVDEHLHKNITELSGGERQRIGLLICELLDRPIWLLDEPTSALGSEMKQTVVNSILKTDKTVLIISHDKEWLSSDLVRIERW